MGPRNEDGALPAGRLAAADAGALRRIGNGELTDLPTAVGAENLRLRLIGTCQLSRGQRQLSVGPSGQRLLALLALHDRVIARGTAAQLLWPDVTESGARSNLRTTLYRLARSCPTAIEATSTGVRLDPSVRVDVRAARSIMTRVLDLSVPMSERQLSEALRCDLQDDLLPEWQEEHWLQPHQARWRQLRLHCLETLSDRLASAGWFGAAVDAALAAVQAERYRESAHEALIRAHLAAGNRTEAINHRAAYHRMLHAELGLAPVASSIGR
ncbi:AfsR/SARP family transcriptional regulator [Solihabitans fulvus]|uniref:AfsR/SARP family transcriptional regulator n=1 Tax=Solihabitans fulvus TaxID=1892852 RepID=UPI0016619534|nr:BTAD domain-containing putative transcriptional regulator [Solihabitans fulvus]